jgi:hypothetical protein
MASAEEAGLVRLKFADQNESNPVTVFEAHTNQISGASKTYPTGETLKAMPKAKEGLILQNMVCKGRAILYFLSDAADTLESEESGAQIGCIMLDEKTGKPVSKKVITFENMTGFTSGGTVDIACGAGTEQRIAYYDVPRGLLLALDPEYKPHVYMGDDTA